MPARKRQTSVPAFGTAGLLDEIKAVPAVAAEDGLFSALWRYDQAIGQRPLAGLDEAGRGPLAGPLVAAAVILPPDFDSRFVADSKKLSPKAREKAFELVARSALALAFSVKTAAEVDSLNPLRASMLAMAESLEKLSVSPAFALFDGNCLPDTPVRGRAVVSGDALSLCVAAASIVAKVTRDNLMMEAHRAYPEYGFDVHKGYGTKSHLAALERHGPCPIHRLSFRGTAKPAPPANRLFP
ncbi:MAG: ribonuclease HII [Deltaproteobacteria bacterium]|jgi:ribonuclease HII|nr:ribonuclease HII [Deltaproteobacteria bacterium]